MAFVTGTTGLLGISSAGSVPLGSDLTPAFKLVAAHSGMAAVVYGATDLEGERVVQFPANGRAYQHWIPLPFGPGFLFMNVNSAKVLDVQDGSRASGALIVQSSWRGAASQVWFLVPAGNRRVVFVNGGSGLVMDVPRASLEPVEFLQQWTWNGGANQLWEGTAVGGSVPKPSPPSQRPT